MKGPLKMEVADESHSGFQSFRDELSPAAKAAVAGENGNKPEWPEGHRPRFCVVLQPEGERPELHICPSAQAMADLMRVQEGQDTYAFPFFGIPIPFTTNDPERLLILHDNTVMRLRDMKYLSELEENVHLQDDRFLGPAEMAMLPERRDAVVRRKPRKQPTPVEANDEFDNGEADDEET